jgi:hypothetical protein
MTMQIVIQVSGQPDAVIGVSDTAIKRARASFNPSNVAHVDHLKALAAAFYTTLETIGAITDPSAAGMAEASSAYQEAFTAAQLVQLGAMMAVSAATAHLVK